MVKRKLKCLYFCYILLVITFIAFCCASAVGEADTIPTDSVPTDAIPTIHSQDDPVHR